MQAESRNNDFALIPFCVATLITMSKSNLEGNGFAWLLTYRPLWMEVMAGTQGRNWSKDDEGMLLTGLLSKACPASCFIQLRTACLEVALPKTGWILPQQSFIKKIPTRQAQRLTWWRQFLKWGSLLPGGSSLCQVDKNNQHRLQIFLINNILFYN